MIQQYPGPSWDPNRTQGSGSIKNDIAQPPPNLFDKVGEILGSTVSSHQVYKAWNRAVVRSEECLGEIDANREQELIQKTISLLLDIQILIPNIELTGNEADNKVLKETGQNIPDLPIVDISKDEKGKKRLHLPSPTYDAILSSWVDPKKSRSSDPTPSGSGSAESSTHGQLSSNSLGKIFTQSNVENPQLDFLRPIYNAFPDISKNYINDLYQSQLDQIGSHDACIDILLDQILDMKSYPKPKVRSPVPTANSPIASTSRALYPIEQVKSSEIRPIDPTEKYELLQLGLELEKWTDPQRKPPESPKHIELMGSLLRFHFPLIPLDHIRTVCQSKLHLVPTWIALEDDFKKQPELRSITFFKEKLPASRDRVTSLCANIPALKNEYQWIKKNARRLNELREEKEREDLLEEQERLNGALIECQCCFDEFTFTKILQCPEGHLFCHGCVRRNADVQIGDGKSIIACMDKSGCDSRFSYAELRKILSRQVLKKLDEIEMENSMDSAQIEGLEKCPFCPFAIIFESSDDKILRCSNEGCKKVSCRLCKMIDHSPKTCEEAKKDESDKSYHLVAEAMTSALIRNCPKCKKGFIKETGCNRITCPKCATVSCYICQKVIGGYTHFSNKANNIQVTSTGSKAMCPLWDDTGNRHYDEISKAHREAAIQIENTVNNLGPEDLSRIKPGPRPPATSYPNHH